MPPASGVAPLWTPRLGGCASIMGRTIPLTPFLPGRGEVQKCRLWRHILHAACQWGCTPLDSSLGGLRFDYGADHPPAPFLPGRGKVQKCRLWRHILHAACQRGCTPLDSPLAGAALQLWGRTIPLPPFLVGRGRIKKREVLRDTLRLLPKGLCPSGLPLGCATHPPAACQWGCTPLDSPLAGAALRLWGGPSP